MLRNQSGKAGTGFWLLSPDNIYFLILLFLPLGLGRHFWPAFSYVSGIRIDYLSPTIYLTDFLIIFLLALWAVEKRRNIKKVLQKVNSKFVLFSVILLLGVFLSGNIFLGFYGFLKFLEFSFVSFYTASSIKKYSQFIKIVKVLSIGILFESLLSIAQYFHQGSLNGIFYFFGERFITPGTLGAANASLNGALVLRPYGTFSHPNVLAGYLAVFMSALLFSIDFRKRRLTSCFFSLALTLSSVALFLTLSRVSIFVWLTVLLLYFFKKINTNKKAFFLSALFLLAVVLGIYFSPFQSRLLSIRVNDQAVTQRLELTRGAWSMFVKNPILGVGINNFLTNISLYQKPTGLSFFLQPVHNIFLLILSQAGVVGFLFFALFMKKTLVKINGTNPKIKLLLFVLIYEIFALGFFDHYFLTLQQGQLILSFVLGISWTKINS